MSKLAETGVFAALSIIACTVSCAQGAPKSPGPDELEGGKVPLKVLIDNDQIRVTLLSWPLGYERADHFARRSDQVIVYLDDGQLRSSPEAGASADKGTGTSGPGKPVVCGKITDDCGPVGPDGNAPPAAKPGFYNEVQGGVSWRPKGASASRIGIAKAYRSIYIELKHGTKAFADPAAVNLPYEGPTGGGAPVHVLVDNEKVRATIVSFAEGFIRKGDTRRRYNTVIVYIDQGKASDADTPSAKYAVVQAMMNHPAGPAVCDPIKDCDSVGPDGNWALGSAPGTVAWHPKGGYVENLKIEKAYRAVYLELK